MSIKSKYGMIFLGAVMAVFLGTGIVSAASSDWDRDWDTKGESVSVAQSETRDSALYVAGQSLNIAGIVKGDVYCAVQSVTITGTVEGDVICAAQNVRIDGKVTGDVRVAAQSASYNGEVAGSISTFAQTLDIGSASVVGQDLNGAAGSATIAGKVGRDLLLSSETMTILGTVERNVGGNYNRLSVMDKAVVGGTLFYTSDNDATIAEGTVKGEISRSTPDRNDSGRIDGLFAGAAFYTFFSMLLIALVIVLLTPRLVHSATDNGVTRLLQSLLVGFFVVFGMPFVLGLLAITIVGIPLAGFVFLSWLLVLLLSGPVFGYYLGRVITRQQTMNPIAIMAAGSTVLLLMYFIPIINLFAVFAAATIGSGMIVLSLVNRYQKPVYKVKK